MLLRWVTAITYTHYRNIRMRALILSPSPCLPNHCLSVLCLRPSFPPSISPSFLLNPVLLSPSICVSGCFAGWSSPDGSLSPEFFVLADDYDT